MFHSEEIISKMVAKARILNFSMDPITEIDQIIIFY